MLRIGSVEIAHPFVQAALSGFSDPPMRRVARRFGASYTINEVVLEKSVLHGSAWRHKLLQVDPDDHPVGAQLMGADPAAFGPAAHLLSEAGYDVIDINFGCPVPKAIHCCRGGYLLSNPTDALHIVRSVVDAVGSKRPVTVKMRRGVDDSATSRRNFFAILDGAFELGVSAVTLHGRTVEQKYRGPSDWRFLKRVKQHVGRHLILGSGDLFTAQDCVRMIHETGVDGVTIARGAIGNPWIFRQCLALWNELTPPAIPTLEEQAEVIQFHIDELVRHHGVHVADRIVAKLMAKYTKMHPTPKPAREAFTQLRSVAEFHDVFARWYGLAETKRRPT